MAAQSIVERIQKSNAAIGIQLHSV